MKRIVLFFNSQDAIEKAMNRYSFPLQDKVFLRKHVVPLRVNGVHPHYRQRVTLRSLTVEHDSARLPKHWMTEAYAIYLKTPDGKMEKIKQTYCDDTDVVHDKWVENILSCYARAEEAGKVKAYTDRLNGNSGAPKPETSSINESYADPKDLKAVVPFGGYVWFEVLALPSWWREQRELYAKLKERDKKDVTKFAKEYQGIGLYGDVNAIDGSVEYTGIIISELEYRKLVHKVSDFWNVDRYQINGKNIHVKTPRYPRATYIISELKKISLASRTRDLTFDQWLMSGEFNLFGLCEVDGHNKYRWSQSVEYNGRVFFAIPVPDRTGVNITRPELQAVNYSTVIAAAEHDISENKRWVPVGGFNG